MKQAATTILSLDGHAKINVPDSLNLMTRFVLEEQGDWFEDELPFLRHFLKPGMQVLDIGANVGCYALSMAAAVLNNAETNTNQGHVWAFEPCGDTFQLLKSSCELNNFSHLNLVQAGLSNRAGQATLYRSQNSELNSLHSKANREYEKETIELKTLDHCLDEFKWDTLDFIKLDAEGEECNILLGGKRLFKQLSPLIMFELKHGNKVHHDLINDFEKIGFNCYTLNKTLNLLLPFDPKNIDGFQLNLFACKADKAIQLEANGLLSQQSLTVSKQVDHSKSIDERYATAIDHYHQGVIESNNTNSLNKVSRLNHCLQAFVIIQSICSEEPNKVDACSAYIRLALLLGKRQEAVSMLRQLLKLTDTKNSPENSLNNNSYFISPLEAYDKSNQLWSSGKCNDASWLRAAALEAYIKYHAFSCYFSGEHALPMLSELNSTMFSSPQMQGIEKIIHQRSEN